MFTAYAGIGLKVMEKPSSLSVYPAYLRIDPWPRERGLSCRPFTPHAPRDRPSPSILLK